ncbi:MAG TPA: AarF/ABC1/UbiB kinase family protein [Gaiellaceae bacterium]|nr:AarF/ABC1/UbiB kinase family protein [Gaiellaceae bacterium]
MSSRPAVRQLGRMSEIAQVAARHGFGYLFETRGPAAVRSRLGREVEVEPEGSPRGQRLREMLDELGPTFVKFGQLLSTRPDIVPPDIVFELKALQDAVTPFPFEQARAVVEEELGLTLEQLYLDFEETPVAAASIGQVHRATLPNGRRVVVKVQRPNAPRQIEADLELMYQLARLARERVRALEFIDTVAVVDEFARSIRQELDYRIEARNAEQFHRNFAGYQHVRVPRVYWSYSRSRVLTLELLEGVQLRDLDVDRYTMSERRQTAYRIAETWMAMIFRHGFFHADPHPANILVLEELDQIGLVDFGTAGQLAPDDSSKLTGLFIEVVNQNVEAIPRRLASLGVRYPKEREEEFVAELRTIFDRYYGASLSEIDPIQVIREAFALIYRMQLTLPTRFILLDRAIATLGSVGIELYPDFNVFEVAKPYARELMIERFTPQRVAARVQSEARSYASMMLELPYQIHDVLQEVRDGQIEVGFRHQGLDDLIHRMDIVFNRLGIAMVAVGGAVTSGILAATIEGGFEILGVPLVAAIGLFLSALLSIWLVWGVIRSGRL